MVCTFPLSPSQYFSLFWGLAVNLSACSGCHRGIYRLVRARCCARVAIHGDGEIVQINHQMAKHTPLQIQDTPWPLGIYKKKVCHEWGELKKWEICTPRCFWQPLKWVKTIVVKCPCIFNGFCYLRTHKDQCNWTLSWTKFQYYEIFYLILTGQELFICTGRQINVHTTPEADFQWIRISDSSHH